MVVEEEIALNLVNARTAIHYERLAPRSRRPQWSSGKEFIFIPSTTKYFVVWVLTRRRAEHGNARETVTGRPEHNREVRARVE